MQGKGKARQGKASFVRKKLVRHSKRSDGGGGVREKELQLELGSRRLQLMGASEIPLEKIHFADRHLGTQYSKAIIISSWCFSKFWAGRTSATAMINSKPSNIAMTWGRRSPLRMLTLCTRVDYSRFAFLGKPSANTS
ncbi:hypothetical protein CIB48_g1154 [Xylaria polymorpha]|nr:hypothetical protein CIB48_g1154 [Xylaria polymorpha]